MTNISKQPLEPEQLNNLFTQLSSHLGRLNNSEINLFLSDLLGEEERVMIAKRLAAIVMLVRGQSLYKISATLHLSSSTVKVIKLKLQEGEYSYMLDIFKNNKNGFLRLLDALDSILHLGGALPHYTGDDRYKIFR